MSKESFKRAIELIEQNPNRCHFSGPKTLELVEKAEKVLCITFSPSYKEFVTNYGAGSVGGEEVYGIVDDNFTNARIPNGIWLTLSERDEVEMPNHLQIIADIGMGEYYCLDYSQLNSEGEPPVVVYVPGFENSEQTYEVLANDFGEYLLRIVLEEIE